MRRLSLLAVIACSALFSSQSVLADPPVITRNVVVMAYATPGQCPSNWRGDASPASGVDISRFGSDSVEGPGVQSCTGCTLNQSGSCVCDTCYSYYDGD